MYNTTILIIIILLHIYYYAKILKDVKYAHNGYIRNLECMLTLELANFYYT